MQRVLVREVQVAYRVAERRACRVLGFARSSFRYRSRRNPRAELRIRLRDLATSRVHYGYQRLWVLLRREGWLVNKKLVYRLYCEEGLGIRRRKPRRRKSVQVREARPPTGQTNESWSMDFMAMEIFEGVRDARPLTASWRHEYNTQRPHSSLGYRTPAGFAAACAASASAKASAPAAHAGCLGQPCS